MAQTKAKKRLIVVSGVIVIVIIIMLAVVSAGTAAKSVTVAQAASGEYSDVKVEVSGKVVAGSYDLSEGYSTFDLYDEDDETGAQLSVYYEGSVSATFGNDVSAICVGTMGDDGVLYCTSLTTKCPSTYESGTAALTVSQLAEYGDTVIDTTVKVAGYLSGDSLTTPGEDVRFAIYDEGTEDVLLSVNYDGALSDEMAVDGVYLVITGSISSDGIFYATDVALGE